MNISDLKLLLPDNILKLDDRDLDGITASDLKQLRDDQINAVIQARVSQAIFAKRQAGLLGRSWSIVAKLGGVAWGGFRFIAPPLARALIHAKNFVAPPRDRTKISPGVHKKLEDFDFHELTSGIANSVTDKLYRSHMPALSKRYAGELTDRDKALTHLENDFAVDPLVADIQEAVRKSLAKSVTKAITYRVIQDFEEQYHPPPGSGVRRFGSVLRWLRLIMVPAYLSAAMVLISIALLTVAKSVDLGAQTFTYSSHVIAELFEQQHAESGEPDSNGNADKTNYLIGGVLKIADLLLIGTLFVMVMIGGYENTVGRIGMSHETPTWFGKLGIAELKMRVAASIVIISSVHLLLTFMSLDLNGGRQNLQGVAAITLIHLVFVGSALILAHIISLTEPHQRGLAERFAGEKREPKSDEKHAI